MEMDNEQKAQENAAAGAAAAQVEEKKLIDFAAIDSKWQAEWAKAKLFESNPDEKRQKFFITFPYPYVNGAPHVGHTYSFLRTDSEARYKRLKGYNVLFPQGFHATGEPIFGTLERLQKGDQNQIDTFKKYGLSDEQIKDFMKGPEFVARFWMGKWTEHLKQAGASIDWRRSFITTQMTPTFSRFIEWQFNLLRRKGYVVQGTHPVVWCAHDQSPTGDHDRYKGEGESTQEFYVIKFTLEDGRIIAPATLRPETIFGVTCMFLNPDTTYYNVRVGIDTWILSADAAKKLADQKKDVKIPKEGFSPKELFGKKCRNPVTGTEVVILPATFVKTDHATGIVMSVPAHAPADWATEAELKANPKMVTEYGVAASALDSLKPVAVIRVPGYSEFPAKDACDKFKITSQNDEKKLDDAKHEIYKKEHYEGTMLAISGKYEGMKVDDCKDQLVKDLRAEHKLDSFWETTGEVVCRCMNKCHVKILENQWFLKFSDLEWKADVKECIGGMRMIPEDVRQQFLNCVDWLENKACARRSGMGTPLPWDPEWKVETLSDSVIYMAYYTIARTINEKKVDAKQLPDAVFDYIFLGIGDPKELKSITTLSDKTIAEMRKEFLYYYPLDLRNSGVDLVQNHLTFMLFHHTAIFGKEHWPKAISVNGYVNVEGEKMSKSKGNIIPMSDLVQKYGADLVRINIVASSEGLSDADWKTDAIKSYRRAIEVLFETAELLETLPNTPKPIYGRPEELLESKVNSAIKIADVAYDNMRFRQAGFELVQNGIGAIKSYRQHKESTGEKYNQKVLRACLEKLVIAIAPLLPHVTEEVWHKLGNTTFASVEKYPAVEEDKIKPELAAQEDYVQAVEEDIRKIADVAKISPKKITLITAAQWKQDELEKIASDISAGKQFAFDVKMKELMAKDDLKKVAPQVSGFLMSVGKKVHSFLGYKKADEKAILESKAAGIGKKFGDATVKVVSEEDAAKEPALSKKAEKAMPGKPAILLE